ncbi:Aquaporin-1 [Nothophoma quercina]|uniref:Aquaporin-1 n=1 Tax=Nothophoma quercina TaxID=749835 RepID=A0ABR3QZ95_9PLEO
MALKNILPLHKKDEDNQADHHHHEKRKRANGHINQKDSTKRKRQGGFTSKWRNELVAMTAEFCGTFLFLFFAFGGTQVANTAAIYSDASTAGQQGNSITQTPNTSVLLYISLIFGFSLMVNVWVFFRVSGGLFNPAVTLGLYLIGALTTVRAILCFIAQMLAGMCAAAVVSAMFPGDLNVSTTLGTGVSIAQGVFMEMFLTSLLIITIFMLAAEKHKATFLAPIGIGLALFVAELVGVFYTGGSLNPTRSFGPCVVTRNFPGYHYIYWFGPLMGTLLAFGVYKIIKMVEYQTVNPGQDFDDHEDALFKPPSNPETAEEVERPNVAAIAAQEAVRAASNSSHDEKDKDGSFGGIDRTLSSSHHHSSNSRDGQRSSGDDYHRSGQHHGHHHGDLEHLPGQTHAPGHENGYAPQQERSYRASQEHRRTSRDHMASDAELLARTGHGHSSRRRNMVPPTFTSILSTWKRTAWFRNLKQLYLLYDIYLAQQQNSIQNLENDRRRAEAYARPIQALGPDALYLFIKYGTSPGITDEDIIVIQNVITDYWTKTATAKENRATYTTVWKATVEEPQQRESEVKMTLRKLNEVRSHIKCFKESTDQLMEENDRLEETVKSQQTRIDFQRETTKKHKDTSMALNDTLATLQRKIDEMTADKRTICNLRNAIKQREANFERFMPHNCF